MFAYMEENQVVLSLKSPEGLGVLPPNLPKGGLRKELDFEPPLGGRK
jgi:hypothetical protein